MAPARFVGSSFRSGSRKRLESNQKVCLFADLSRATSGIHFFRSLRHRLAVPLATEYSFITLATSKQRPSIIAAKTRNGTLESLPRLSSALIMTSDSMMETEFHHGIDNISALARLVPGGHVFWAGKFSVCSGTNARTQLLI